MSTIYTLSPKKISLTPDPQRAQEEQVDTFTKALTAIDVSMTAAYRIVFSDITVCHINLTMSNP